MYKIMRTDKAEDQLRDIIYYIADDSESVREMQRNPLSCSGTVGNYPADAL